MAFTTAQLATQLNVRALSTWAASTPENQEPLLQGFTEYFTAVQTWITGNNGATPFGWNNLHGLTTRNGTQVVLQGPAQRAPFNDAFDDVRTHLMTPGFRLYQAGQAIVRLIGVLGRLG
ncbi:hypothetical protein [Pseudomonas sp. NPDC096950]|uniref:hypothetical protein n=1 Tax=Pseudomonas sp. NPDC096950 TaxID=3364485 RepID=UPI00383A53C1